MGDFQSGKWAVILSIYFFVFFLIVYSIQNINSDPDYDYGIDTDGLAVKDMSSTFSDEWVSGQCAGAITSPYCANHPLLQNNDSCENTFVYGTSATCNWNPATETCDGIIFFGCDDPAKYNKSICDMLSGCQWNEFSVPQSINILETQDVSILSTIGIMSGFTAEIGIPGAYKFIIFPFIFWIPAFMLLWCLYMALPFLHR